MSTDNFSGWAKHHNNATVETTARFQPTSNYTMTMDRTASWCPNCGRRRGADGRCPDCDPWWTSPVVRYGGALSLLVGLLLLGGIALTQSNSSYRQVRSLPSDVPNGSLPGSSPVFASPNYGPGVPTFGTGSGFGSSSGYTYVPGSFSTPSSHGSFAPVNLAGAIGPSTEELERRAIEQLRQLTAYTDAVVETQRQSRWEDARASVSRIANSSGRQQLATPVAAEAD